MRAPPANRALIIGARAQLAALTASAFQDAGWAVRCETGGQHDEWPATAAREAALIVNTAPERGLRVERAVLERGGTLITVCPVPAPASRALRAGAGAATGTVLLNAGLAPGVTNLVAADLLRAHPETDELEIVLTVSAAALVDPSGVALVHRGLTTLDRHRTTLVPLPPPFGARECVGFAEDDAGWLGGFAEGRLVRVYTCFAEPDVHRRLVARNRAGTMTTVPRSLIGLARAHTAAPVDGEPVAHWIAAKRRGRRLGARSVQCQGAHRHTARSAVVFAGALIARDRRCGCCDPEELFTLAELEPDLADVGISVVSHLDVTDE